jgi:hypothetical protein
MRKRISLLVAALMLALTMSFGSLAAFATHNNGPHGNQTEVQSCETNSGNLPRGQQPVCQGSGLEQEEETFNKGGNAPKGQQ